MPLVAHQLFLQLPQVDMSTGGQAICGNRSLTAHLPHVLSPHLEPPELMRAPQPYAEVYGQLPTSEPRGDVNRSPNTCSYVSFFLNRGGNRPIPVRPVKQRFGYDSTIWSHRTELSRLYYCVLKNSSLPTIIESCAIMNNEKLISARTQYSAGR